MHSAGSQERKTEIAKLVAGAKAVLDRDGVSRSSLSEILKQVQILASKSHLWSSASYPDPEKTDVSILYNVAEEPDQTFALYLDVACPGKKVPPHNHTTWACIATVEGCEDNVLYGRDDNETALGHVHLRQIGFVEVKPGRGIALMPDDIHAIANSQSTFGRHLHFYGKALEAITTRLQFDLERKMAKVMPPVVTDRI
jgi:predicted metal-dependent enzyme (double-stranded beta helix superfamily)